eukprot:CAMPEP_0113447986 /NCGR_PEP_ID=MMETSP0014_2-20120614/4526_1 /TAXON_ID=2857 /ORGANISM="Nitzschia sp." /LENGTH=581 /DNA_ID=CAMNT_0000339169 /DNA_START=94 /DNA_END=1839 /DNA_ORIENTATION=+ /assembly_acc=CAM_ASM_000159
MMSSSYNHHHNNANNDAVVDDDNKLMMMSDLERDRHALEEQHDFASQLLDRIGDVLDGVDDVVTNLEDDSQLLPTAILRRCTEFADLIGRLAQQLEGQSTQEREELANVIHQDFVHLQQQAIAAEEAMAAAAAAAEFQAYHRQDGLELHDGLLEPTVEAAATATSTNTHPEISTSPASTTTSSSFSTAPLVSPSPTSNVSSGNDAERNQFNESSRPTTTTTTTTSEIDTELATEVQPNDILQALSGVSFLLRDVESSFRDIGRSEAEELADVGLTLVRLFLMSLQNIYETLTPENVIEAATTAATTQMIQDGQYYPPSSATKSRSSVVIEELSAEDSFYVSANGDETIDENRPTNVDWSSLNSIRRDLDLDNDEGGNGSSRSKPTSGQSSRSKTKTRRSSRSNNNNKKKKVRCLWPPVGPHVSNIMDWTKDEAGKHPILAVALGLTLWPVAITTAVVGTSAVLIDGAVQDIYNHFSDGPLLRNLEQGAAQLYQTGRLGFVTSKLVTRQTARVVSRQIERQGGVGPVLDNIKDGVVDRLVHPVETVGMVWDGLNVCAGFVSETAGHVIAMRQESNHTAQELS